MTEYNGAAVSPLDARIAAVLADAEPSSKALAGIIREASLAVDAADLAVEAERGRSLDPDNADPEKSVAMVAKIELARDRLEAALPRLQEAHRCALAREQAGGVGHRVRAHC